MTDYVKLYKKIINRLINDSFPLLKNEIFWVYETEKISHSADIKPLFFKSLPIICRIRIHPKMRGVPNNIIVGLFAHELSHPEIWKKRGIIKNILWGVGMTFSKKWCKLDEKNTDILAIEKGYGRELLANRIWRYKQKDKQLKELKDRYLTPKQIKYYIKKSKP